MKHLLIDGMNFLHRARAGFQGGDYAVQFNFFRNLRSTIEFHDPDRVTFVLEGHPKYRHDELATYKANRQLDPTDPDYERKDVELTKFHLAVASAISILKLLPVNVVVHPDYECDDVIAYLVKTYSNFDNECVIVSSDTDFIQTIQRYPSCHLYNPVKKAWVETPNYDYVTWKAWRGDSSDNIPGVSGIGDKRAAILASDSEAHANALSKSPKNSAIFHRNVRLIRFHEFTESELETLEVTHTRNANVKWDYVRELFDSYDFKSITNDKSWKKFVSTFQNLK